MECSIEGCASRAICRGWCTKHYTRWKRHGDPLTVTRNEPIAPDAAEKPCPRCEKVRPLTCFRRRGAGGQGGYAGWCKDCERVYHVARKTDAEKRIARRASSRKYASSARKRELHLRKLYDLTSADVEAMLDRQGGRCAICQGSEPGGNAKHWHVDHDHATGRVRGLLCMKCNVGLGYFQDDPTLLINACAYLGVVPLPGGCLGYYRDESA